jgi:hypothetical protein
MNADVYEDNFRRERKLDSGAPRRWPERKRGRAPGMARALTQIKLNQNKHFFSFYQRSSLF